MRRWMVDIAVLFTRHHGRLESSSAVLWMEVYTSSAGIDLHGRREQQLCVPSVRIEGKSYRMKDQITEPADPLPAAALAAEEALE